MKNRFNYLFVFLFLFMPASGQIFRTEALSDEIHTIQVLINGDWKRFPVIDMRSGDYVRLSFDRISEQPFQRLHYRIIHCNADWTPSSLSAIDYIEGFEDNPIDDYAGSVSTTVDYTNFLLQIPNNDLSLKVSGNYVIQVYEEDNQDNILLNACFSVLDAQVNINGSYSANTLIDAYREHQQVSFTINHPSLNIRDPFSDLKIFIRQNQRTDNQKTNLKPSGIQPNKLVYENDRNLIFEAGNEYRRFETPSHRYNGLRIWHIEYRRPFYYAQVIPEKIRANTRYIYDEDQNGKFFIRNAEGNDSDTDADYFFVSFNLEAEEPYMENIYIQGNFTQHSLDERYLMHYDYDKREYYTTLLLKQGMYNYHYLAGNTKKLSTSVIEGNYYETGNEYQVWIYHRAPGQRYDSLIGFLNITK